MDTRNFIFFCLAIILIVILIGFVLVGLSFVFAQEAPDAIVPTPVPVPTPTSPNPNLQYLPQKAYVQSYAPEVGIPSNSQPLQAVPQTVPVSQGIGGFDIGNIMGYLASIAAAGTYIKTHLVGKKTDKNQEIVQEVAQTQVKQIEVEEEHLGLTYDQMPNKGNEITNKPVIKQENIKEIKDKAIETASKA